MNSQQLELLLTYISNEIALNAIRGTGMAWARQQTDRDNLVKKLRESVVEPIPEDTEVKSTTLLSPLEIDMLMFMFVHYNIIKHPAFSRASVECLRAITKFANHGLIMNEGYYGYSLTKKGEKYVNKILNTTIDSEV